MYAEAFACFWRLHTFAAADCSRALRHPQAEEIEARIEDAHETEARIIAHAQAAAKAQQQERERARAAKAAAKATAAAAAAAKSGAGARDARSAVGSQLGAARIPSSANATTASRPPLPPPGTHTRATLSVSRLVSYPMCVPCVSHVCPMCVPCVC